ncbi:phosphate-starvation-inducible PsiE family protein [Marinobacteraceae bacterium S3BR75-40.1]
MESKFDEQLLTRLNGVIRWAVRLLALLMVFVIVMGVVDVGWTLYQKLMAAPVYILTISDMLATFGAFMAVLIAIEIFINITIYLRENVIHVKIVIATALMAIARKVIILDLEKIEPAYLWGIGSVVVAMAVAYWLVHLVGHHDDEHIAADRTD